MNIKWQSPGVKYDITGKPQKEELFQPDILYVSLVSLHVDNPSLPLHICIILPLLTKIRKTVTIKSKNGDFDDLKGYLFTFAFLG